MDFSVLMTVYAKETSENFDKSLNSILVDQTVLPNQFVLVYDGPVGDELKEVTTKYQNLFKNEFILLELPENVGQGLASQAGFEKCKYDLIARMDSDDISVPDRFEKEIQIFKTNNDIDVVGGFIAEFIDDPDVISGIRTLPEHHEDIARLFKRRNPINNVTVMYKTAAIKEIGGYSELRTNEDFNLYVRLLLAGKKMYNIQDTLVKVRTGNDMIDRRGDINIYKAWKKNQELLFKRGITKWYEYFMICSACYCFVRCPKFIKKFLYKYVLRKN